MPAPSLPHAEVVRRIGAVFRRWGYDGASLARISAATGLGRSSLYHYFPGGKDDMAAAVLDDAAGCLSRDVLARLEGPGPVRARLVAMAAALDTFYGGGRSNCLLGALALGEGHARFAAKLKAAFRRWIGAIAAALEADGQTPERARARAEEAVLAVQGALVLARGLGDPAPFRRVTAALPDRLLAP
jgi:TetR/AcrR family transcriptional regulator, lmrAB and yxaGH operons repressor